MRKMLERKKSEVSEDKPLPRTTESLPHLTVGDEAFLLKQYLLRLFPIL
jgi:hypothetical protein